ncbi:MAG TPA: VWA domain-containing protein [Chitinophagales bacterium]|nr:VWA domain-containing protein [Chitinophagales bacterium]HNE47108.1 VWA domain-containing protein [Chitinophagales bacterium]HNI54544.1 VWA domain-containing protein [Chitinophagales bacterium]HNK98560.1 VWA domain-containing protein [Chitinophagales bacterium]HNO29551.1 VWA domain-containing protein [Chitinophagales bacterium]
MQKVITYRLKMMLLCILIATSSSLFSQGQTTRILIILDASRSMGENFNRTSKMQAARDIVGHIVDSLNGNPNIQLAMRVYGHQSPQPLNDCEDSKLEVAFRTKNAATIKSRMETIRPQGVTPIAYSIEQSIADFGQDAKNYRNILILVSDGFESCGRNPCEVVQRMRQQGILTKSYVIGIGIDALKYSEFSCMGEFTNISTEDQTEDVANSVIAKIFNSVFVRVDLLDTENRPEETDAVMTFYDRSNHLPKFNYYHTINPKGNPDTITLDPAVNYDMQVHTVPETWKRDVNLTSGKINVITQPAPQGYLRVDVRGETYKGKINCIIKKNGDIINAQQTEYAQKMLTGDYDVEILTIPVIYINHAQVEQDKTTTLEIAAPGFVTFSKNEALIGGIYEYRDNKLTEIYELNEASLKEAVAIQPGKYKVIYRYASKKRMDATITVEFEVVSGTSLTVRL